jgi:hypothetical protein
MLLIMTTVERIESQLESQLAGLSPDELRELANWLATRAREAAAGREAGELPEIDPERFSSGAAEVLRKHRPLLKKLAQ